MASQEASDSQTLPIDANASPHSFPDLPFKNWSIRADVPTVKPRDITVPATIDSESCTPFPELPFKSWSVHTDIPTIPPQSITVPASANSTRFPDLPFKSWTIHSDIPTIPPRSVTEPTSVKSATPAGFPFKSWSITDVPTAPPHSITIPTPATPPSTPYSPFKFDLRDMSQRSHPLPINQLPDAGLIFDTLLKRERFVRHPAGFSSMMSSVAALVMHSVFRGSHRDVHDNQTSSFDLSALYGRNLEAQNRVRLRDGRGLLYPDVFAEDELLFLPPSVCVLLVLFNRNHNYIAKMLLEIDERRNYAYSPSLNTNSPAERTQFVAQEEELFQTARLINCGWFASIVFSDYFSYLGAGRDGHSGSPNPSGKIRLEDPPVFERRKGDIGSVKPNYLYRLHAMTSAEDEKWTEKSFGSIFAEKSPEDVTKEDLIRATHKIAVAQHDLTQWTFGGLQRKADGTYKDEDLANVLQDSTEHPAAAFRARSIPAVMRLYEIMNIEQNRTAGACSFNDFRKGFGLDAYKSFLEWNSDKEIANVAERLYGAIDRLELYVGLQAEEANPVKEGMGPYLGPTISYAILSEAISLLHSDRFFTHDYTPLKLTAWGFADCQRNLDAPGFGSILGRFLLRTLPNNYTADSVYTLFPFVTPGAVKTGLSKLKALDQYDLVRPTPRTPVRIVSTYSAVADVLKNGKMFVTSYAAKAARIINGKGFYIVDGPAAQERVHRVLAKTPESVEKITWFFYETTRELIHSSSVALVGKNTHSVDVVRDVLRLVSVYWVASELAGFDLKTKEHPSGHYTPEELYHILSDIYSESFVFLNAEASAALVPSATLSTQIETLLGHIKRHLGTAAFKRGCIVAIFTKLRKSKPQHHELVKHLFSTGLSNDEIANTVLALMVGSTAELSLALTNVVNLYLSSADQSVPDDAVRNTNGALDGFVYEALRLDPPFQGAYRTVTGDYSAGNLTLRAGDRLFLDVADANLDETVFPSVKTVNASRGDKDTLHGDGIFSHLGERLTVKIMAEVLRAVFELENVRRAPGQSGVLRRFKNHARPELRFAYLDKNQLPAAWPTSMSIMYDAPAAK